MSENIEFISSLGLDQRPNTKSRNLLTEFGLRSSAASIWNTDVKSGQLSVSHPVQLPDQLDGFLTEHPDGAATDRTGAELEPNWSRQTPEDPA